MFFLLLAGGTILILVLEHSGFLADKSWDESFFYAFFPICCHKERRSGDHEY